MATSYPASLGNLGSNISLESFYRSRHRGTAASLPALLPAAASLLPEMEEEAEEDLPQRSRLRRRDHRSLTPTRRTRPPSTRTSSGDDESFTFRSERNLANPRKPNEKTEVEMAADSRDGCSEDDDGTKNRLSEVKEENEDEEQYRRHSKDDELLFRSGRRRSI